MRHRRRPPAPSCEGAGGSSPVIKHAPTRRPPPDTTTPDTTPVRAGRGPARSMPSAGPPGQSGRPARRWGSVAAVVLTAVGLMLLSGAVAVALFGHYPAAPVVLAQGELPVVQRAPAGADELNPPAPTPVLIPAEPVAAPAAPPTHLQIPAVGVNTDLINLATQDDGTLEVPKDFAVAGWWDQGAAPGDPGPAVIVGHIDSYRGPAVFYRLRELRPGATVTITRSDGSTAVFIVDALREFPKQAFPTNLVYGATTEPTLRLITCGGGFDYQHRSYLDNIVVFAHQLPPPAPVTTSPADPASPAAPAPTSTSWPGGVPPWWMAGLDKDTGHDR